MTHEDFLSQRCNVYAYFYGGATQIGKMLAAKHMTAAEAATALAEQSARVQREFAAIDERWNASIQTSHP